jgi:hypothetical protein
MGRVNIIAEDGTLAGHFHPDKAEMFSDGKRWDGSNMIGECSGSQWVDEYLYRTAGGKWVLNTDSTRYMSGPDEFGYVTAGQARDWLLRSKDNDEAIEKYFGDIPDEEDRRPGRPEIGEPVQVRLGDLLPPVDAYAQAHGIKRAEAIRRLVTTGLAAATASSSARGGRCPLSAGVRPAGDLPPGRQTAPAPHRRQRVSAIAPAIACAV